MSTAPGADGHLGVAARRSAGGTCRRASVPPPRRAATRSGRRRRRRRRILDVRQPSRSAEARLRDDARMEIVVRGHHLPGTWFRSAGVPIHHVHVALQVGKDPEGLVPGDASTAEWRTEVRVEPLEGGGHEFRGPAVHGPPRRAVPLLDLGRSRARRDVRHVPPGEADARRHRAGPRHRGVDVRRSRWSPTCSSPTATAARRAAASVRPPSSGPSLPPPPDDAPTSEVRAGRAAAAFHDVGGFPAAWGHAAD